MFDFSVIADTTTRTFGQTVTVFPTFGDPVEIQAVVVRRPSIAFENEEVPGVETEAVELHLRSLDLDRGVTLEVETIQHAHRIQIGAENFTVEDMRPTQDGLTSVFLRKV